MFNGHRRPHKGGSPTLRPTYQPRLENLEDRMVPAIIGGTVFLDANNTGLLTQGEQGLASSTLKLENSNGNTVATTTSAANGQYEFIQRNATTLTPTFTTTDAVFTQSPAGTTNTALLSQFNPSLGTLTSIDVIASGSLQSNVQLENLGPTAGQVQVDLNGTLSYQIPGAGPITGSTSVSPMLNTVPPSGSSTGTEGDSMSSMPGCVTTATSTVNTNSSSSFSPTYIPSTQGTANQGTEGDSMSSTPGCSTTPTSTVSTNNSSWTSPMQTSVPSTQVTTDQGTEGGALPPLPGYSTTVTSTVTTNNSSVPGTGVLTSSPSTQLTANLPGFAGGTNQAPFTGTSSETFPTTTLTGTFSQATITNPTVLEEYTGTGTVALGESSSADACTCGPANLLSMITSTAQGKVHVVYNYTPSSEIGPGNYTIVQTQQPPGGYTPGYASSNGQTIPGSEITHTIPVTVTSPSDVLTTNNFAELPPSALSGKVYVVGTNAPLQGVTITLTGKDTFGNTVNRTTSTASDGTYSFGSLLPGTYALTETPPANYEAGPTTQGSLGGTVSGQAITAIPVGVGVDGTNYNFSEQQAPQVVPNVPPVVPAVPPSTPTTPTFPTMPAVTPPPADTLTYAPSKFFFFGASLGSFGW